MFVMIRGPNTSINIIQRVLDLLILVALTYAVEDVLVPKALAKVLVVYCGLLLAVVFPLFKIYSFWRKTLFRHQLRTLASAWFTVLVAFNVIIMVLSNEDQLAVLIPYGLFTSAGFNYWALLVFGGLGTARVVVHFVIGKIRSQGGHQQVAIILGAGKTGRKLAKYLFDNKWFGISTAGFFDDKIPKGTNIKSGFTKLGTVLGTINECRDFIQRESVNFVFIALPMRAEEKITRIIGELGTSGHAVLMVQDLFSFGIQKARTQHLGELQVLDFYLFPRWKRVFDIVFSTMAILVTLPFWVVIMLAIKADDGGPIFFRHPRVMEGGKRFQCIKFRSMHVDAQDRLKQLLQQDPVLRQQWRQFYKLKTDPRITEVGKFLRRFNLDELPQFLNVFLGQMSVVGARPVVPEELKKYYREVTLTYCAMKPGITGPWQVSKERDTVDYAGRVELDRRYVINCSIWLDLMIIAKTLWRTVFGDIKRP